MSQSERRRDCFSFEQFSARQSRVTTDPKAEGRLLERQRQRLKHGDGSSDDDDEGEVEFLFRLFFAKLGESPTIVALCTNEAEL